MEELKKVRRVAEKGSGTVTETLLVIDATTGQNGLAQAREFFEATEVTGVVLTKLDGSAKGGIVFAIETELGIPVKLVGVGEQIGDLDPVRPRRFRRRPLRSRLTGAATRPERCLGREPVSRHRRPTRMNLRAAHLAPIVLASLLVLAACGDDEVAEPLPPAEQPGVPTVPPATVPPAAPGELLPFSPEMYAAGAPLVAEFVGLPIDEFEAAVTGSGYGPVRVAAIDGQGLDLTADLVPGRVDVVVVTRDGTQIVVDAAVENDPSAAPLEEPVPVVVVFDGVSFYPACGNEDSSTTACTGTRYSGPTSPTSTPRSSMSPVPSRSARPGSGPGSSHPVPATTSAPWWCGPTVSPDSSPTAVISRHGWSTTN